MLVTDDCHQLLVNNMFNMVFILESPFINPELLEIEKKTCRIASCEMVFESVAARLVHEQEFKEWIVPDMTHYKSHNL